MKKHRYGIFFIIEGLAKIKGFKILKKCERQKKPSIFYDRKLWSKLSNISLYFIKNLYKKINIKLYDLFNLQHE